MNESLEKDIVLGVSLLSVFLLLFVVIIQGTQLSSQETFLIKYDEIKRSQDKKIVSLTSRAVNAELLNDYFVPLVSDLTHDVELYKNQSVFWHEEYDFLHASFMNDYNMDSFPEVIDGLYNNKSIHVQVTDDIARNLEILCHEYTHHFIFTNPEHFLED